ncbi:unnamed protein product [Schistosoma mattheei]|nr:unnamed protein product [Schistosoma mattheei]
MTRNTCDLIELGMDTDIRKYMDFEYMDELSSGKCGEHV